MRVARVLAQAKINLVLQIGPRDRQGYHPLVTQFQRIELVDEVTVRVGGSGQSVDSTGPQLPRAGLGPATENLAFRAAAVYADHSGWGRAFAIEIVKHIPVGGGLGGGSADAGAVLRAMDALAPRALGIKALMQLGATLGADVPFMAADSPSALGIQRGDVVAPLQTLPEREVILAVPAFSIATADAYRWLDEAGGGTLPDYYFNPPPGKTSGVVGFHSWEEAALGSLNDFEAALEPRFPALRTLREQLDACGAVVARLSGSGSTVFGIYSGDTPAPRDLSLDALVVPTRTSSRVVQVDVLE